MNTPVIPFPPSSQPSVPAAPAATLVIVRDGPHGPEVLLQKRSSHSRFSADAWVFPGGKVDAADADALWNRHCSLSDAEAARRLALPSVPAPANAITTAEENQRAPVITTGARAWWIAAIRECFEEAGLLLARTPDGAPTPQNLAAWRRELGRHGNFASVCQREHLQLDTNALHYLGHWVTPPALPIRFDTRFFLAQAPADQQADHSEFEAVDTRWQTPEDTLAMHRRGEIVLIFPTLLTLKALTGYPHCDSLIRHLGREPDRAAD